MTKQQKNEPAGVTDADLMVYFDLLQRRYKSRLIPFLFACTAILGIAVIFLSYKINEKFVLQAPPPVFHVVSPTGKPYEVAVTSTDLISLDGANDIKQNRGLQENFISDFVIRFERYVSYGEYPDPTDLTTIKYRSTPEIFDFYKRRQVRYKEIAGEDGKVLPSITQIEPLPLETIKGHPSGAKFAYRVRLNQKAFIPNSQLDNDTLSFIITIYASFERNPELEGLSEYARNNPLQFVVKEYRRDRITNTKEVGF